MKTNMPGFHAEAALYKTTAPYTGESGLAGMGANEGVAPAICCLVGSGGTTCWKGPCPKIL